MEFFKFDADQLAGIGENVRLTYDDVRPHTQTHTDTHEHRRAKTYSATPK